MYFDVTIEPAGLIHCVYILLFLLFSNLIYELFCKTYEIIEFDQINLHINLNNIPDFEQ